MEIEFTINGRIRLSENEVNTNNTKDTCVDDDVSKSGIFPGVDSIDDSSGQVKSASKRRASQAGAVTHYPKSLAIPTLSPYHNAFSVVNNNYVYVQPVLPQALSMMEYRDDTLFFKGAVANRANLTEYFDKSPNTLTLFDFPTLRFLYTIILNEYTSTCVDAVSVLDSINENRKSQHVVTLYLPAVINCFGNYSNSSKGSKTAMLDKIRGLKNLLGVIKEHNGLYSHESFYPVISFNEYNPNLETISFASPYLEHLISVIIEKSQQPNPPKNPSYNSNYKSYMVPFNSFLIDAGILSEKNKRAVEIVCIIVTLVEQCGNHVPNIKAGTIVNRIPDLKYAIDSSSSSDANKTLRRSFSKAWELLRDKTRLTKVYKDIEIPDFIPTLSTLDHLVNYPAIELPGIRPEGRQFSRIYG